MPFIRARKAPNSNTRVRAQMSSKPPNNNNGCKKSHKTDNLPKSFKKQLGKAERSDALDKFASGTRNWRQLFLPYQDCSQRFPDHLTPVSSLPFIPTLCPNPRLDGSPSPPSSHSSLRYSAITEHHLHVPLQTVLKCSHCPYC